MPFDKENEQETQGEADHSAALAEISTDLFGEKEGNDGSEGVEHPEGESESGEGAAEAGTSDSSPQSEKSEGEEDASSEQEGEQNAGEQENSEAVQATGAPSTWTKEAIAKWATVDPVVQAEVLKREADMMRGIEGYKAAADMGGKVSKIIEPYAAVLAAENIDPFQMLQSFAGNHYLLMRGTPEQKIQLAANILKGYKIDMPSLLEHMAGGVDEDEDPKYAALKKEIDELKGGITKQNTASQEAALAQVNKEIDAFEADPKNIYFKEVAADMQQLFATGQAGNLQDAYDKAVWSNPATRQKELDRLTAEKVAAKEQVEKERFNKKAKAQGDKLHVGDKPRDGTVVTGSIDDTLNETLAAIESRG